MPHDPRLPRYVSRERARQFDDEWRAQLSGVPKGHIPYAVWSQQVDDHCRARDLALARPQDLTDRLGIPTDAPITIAHLLRYQESFYRNRYEDPAFTFDRSRLHLPQERVAGILDALTRTEVDYPLVVATPRTLAEWERSPSEANDESTGRRAPPDPGRGGGERPRAEGVGPRANRQVRPALPTLHRFLLDTLLRSRDIPVWERTDPGVDTFLDQVRDLTLGDLTRTDLRGPDGTALAHTAEGWLPYLQVLYPTLPRPTVTPGYLDLSFTAWERDPPASRTIPNVQGPHGGTVTIQHRSLLDAITHRYPLITPSRYLTLFAQYHGATGEYLDTSAWSWTFGTIDPQRFPDHPCVRADWGSGGLCLYRLDPGLADSGGRLRSSR